MKPLWNSLRYGFKVTHVVLETKDTFSVYITGKDLVNFKYKAGQYANITFLQKGLWFTHPFSFSAEHNDTYIRFTMKALGDYTKRLGELTPGTRVILDGPLGLFIEETSQNDKLLFIAGGIGITPIRSMIGDIMRRKKNIIMIYAARTVDDIAFRKEFELFQAKQPFPIHYVLSTPTPGYESGFLDREKLVRLVPDFFERDVFLCGPPPMMAATVENLKGLGFKNVNLHYEMFSF
jgi:predicted ferric reductase